MDDRYSIQVIQVNYVIACILYSFEAYYVNPQNKFGSKIFI